MEGQSLARLIIGVLGSCFCNMIAGLLFVSPAPTIWRIWKKKSTEEFQPYTYLASTMNCMFWVLYGLPYIHPDSTLVITINSFGLLMEIVYLLIFMRYTTKKKYRAVIIVVVLGEVALVGAVAALSLLCFTTHHYRSMFVGSICAVFVVTMYGSPLSITAKVVRTRSAEFMPFWLSLACFANASGWFIYAFLKSVDPYIAVGNGIGIVLGLIQLYVYGYYSLEAKKNDRVGPQAEIGKPQLDKIPPL